MGAPVSVIIVSRGRPRALHRCLTGLAQLDYDPFEIIVVACPDGQAIAAAHPQAEHIKLIGFDEPNISAARNLGIAQAAGEIIAFIDDDAVPEPLWLQHLTHPFSDPDISATGGYVIGRNGISFQWTARSVDAHGVGHPIDLTTDAPQTPTPPAGHALKTEGTNMAFRSDVLREMGGFDPGFQFYLDETDLNMRLALAGHKTAIAPLAQVHHGFEESDHRHGNRVPKDLTQIGASQRLFLRKYCPEAEQEPAWHAFCKDQRLRLLRLVKGRKLKPDGLADLLHGLQTGGDMGLTREITRLASIQTARPPFTPFKGRPAAPRRILSGRIWQAPRLRREAAQLAAQGNIVSLYIFLPSPRYHTVSFKEDGYWEQFGGRFGRSTRSQPVWKYYRLSERVRQEYARTAAIRGQI
ncbi:putative glycosyl transferase [Pelagimonas phthalicica]|uniref:Putative glycosyl transferase n=1 Tax=Pelagimonas phthalicica TaxID=1037362 RepID=A0A238JHA7_9RHOB|nr:glycosyltransferase [Pelagimonas phthalicica]TDS89667.1 glycosyl transferase family 2 [Pelagimonas phthalicica]SMX29835.1 putative glycosyl transferase [Pelagimonas phthalicica]